MKLLSKIVLTASAILLAFSVITVQAQEMKKQNEIEKKQNEIQNLYIKAYGIMDHYPNVSYTYEYNNGKVKAVKVVGVPNVNDKATLASCLMKLEGLKGDIVNLQDNFGVYFVTETEPEPKDGYRDLYNDLYGNLDYPKTAEKYGVEGTVFVKFVVGANGEIKEVTSTNNIETSFDAVKEELITEAKKAVKATSGQWEPAKVGNIPVAQWVYLPVKFNLENSHFTILRN